MLLALSVALAAPPPHMPLDEQLAQADVVALGEAVRVEFQTLDDGEQLDHPGSFWTEYRVTEAVRGAEVGDLIKVQPNTYCMPVMQTVRRFGDSVYRVERDTDLPWWERFFGEAEALDPNTWLLDADGQAQTQWLLLRRGGGDVLSPVQFTHPGKGDRADAVRTVVEAAR